MNIRIRSILACLSLVAAVQVATSPVVRGGDNRYSPQPQSSLRPMLSIDWHKGPNLPQGFQDSSGGVIGNTLVTACGFCQGVNGWPRRKELEAQKPGRYPRGFLSKVWGLNLGDPGQGWRSMPDFPGVARQGLVGAVADDVLYVWGGFNYNAPFCYRDGYKLAWHNGRWEWTSLPALDSPRTASGVCAIGSKIYLCGGADYDEQRFYTAADRSGALKRFGAMLQVIDTKDLSAGWRLLPECPGTPRWVVAMAAVKGKIYLIGGATGDVPDAGYGSVVDNWTFDPASNRWQRLRDLPISSGNFPAGRIVFRDRYLLLIGGYQYQQVANPDGTLREKYGHASRINIEGDYYNDVFVYDTQTGLFGTADKLPLNNNGPLTVVRGDKIYLIGGEVGVAVVEGELYGHHPDLLLIGTIRETAR